MFVEDNPTFQQSFKEILSGEFRYLEIVEAVDGEDAIQKINAFDVDLIFMDIKLPDENGLSVTKKTKTIHPEIIAVILTSYEIPEYREAAQQSKADYCISKDSPTGKILDIVKSVLVAPKKTRRNEGLGGHPLMGTCRISRSTSGQAFSKWRPLHCQARGLLLSGRKTSSSAFLR